MVLAVDDDPSILRIIEMLLTRYGYTVRMAISAEKALELLRTILPNVALRMCKCRACQVSICAR